MHSQKRPIAKTSLYRNIAISFIILSIAIAVTIFYVTFSWATIIVTPKKISLSDSYTVTIGKKPTSLAEGALFGRVIKTTVDGEGTFSSTGKEVKTQKARGTITIVNTTVRPQPLRATTRLLTSDGFLFRTEEFVNAPAQGRVTVPVIADKEGSLEGINLTRFTIPGLWEGLRSSIYGQDFDGSIKGQEEVSLVTQEDLDRARDEVMEKIKNKFALMLDIPDQSFQPKKAIKISDVKMAEFSSSRGVGDATKEFQVKMKASVTGVVFDESESTVFVKQRSQNQLGIGYELILTEENQIRYALEGIDATGTEATVRFDVNAAKIRGEDTSQFMKSNLAGLSKDQIQEYFATYGDIEATDVRFYPFWVQRSPLLTDHIHILFQK